MSKTHCAICGKVTEVQEQAYPANCNKCKEQIIARLNLAQTNMASDPGYCGIGGFNTGKHDPLWPVCKTSHDPIFDDLLNGKISSSQLETLGTFGKALGYKWLQSVYTLFAAPVYFLVGGVLGMARYRQILPTDQIKQDETDFKGDGML